MIETAPYLMFEPQEELWWRVWVPLVYMLFTLLVCIPVLVAAGLEALLVQSLEAVSSRKISLKVEGERQFSWPGCFRNYLKQSQDGFGMWTMTTSSLHQTLQIFGHSDNLSRCLLKPLWRWHQAVQICSFFQLVSL